MNIVLYNTQYNLSIHKMFTDVELKKVEKLTIDMINHNIVSLRRMINHRSANDVLTNFYCDIAVRLEGASSICNCINELRHICGIKEEVYQNLITYTLKKCGVYELVAKDICKNIYKEN